VESLKLVYLVFKGHLNRNHFRLKTKLGKSNFILVILTCISVFAFQPSAMAEPVKIGISLPLSGNSATLGKQFVAGARLAMRLLPDANNIELVISDDGCDEKLAELAIDDIKNAGAVLVTGFLCNEPVFAAASMLVDSSIPILVAGARSNRITKDRKRFSWNVWQMAPRDADASQSAFEILVKRWKSVPYAIVDDGTVFGRTQADEFRALMEEAGVKPQFVDNFRPSQSTQAGLIRRLGKSGVEAIYLAAGDDDVALIGRNMIEFGSGLEIATGEGISLLPYIDDNKGVPIGLLAIMPAPPEDVPALRFLNKTIEAANLEPEPYLLLGYATIQVVVDYLGSADKSFSGKLFNTILGPVEFDKNGRNITRQYFLYRWNGQSFTRIKTDN
jgi:branched-chain amino acid transport system substrate-binding protein